MQVFELEPLFFATVKLPLEKRNACIELEEDVCVLLLEIVHKSIVWLQEDSWRILDIVGTFFGPIVGVFDDDLIEWVSDIFFYTIFDFSINVDTFLNIFDVLYQLLDFRDTALLLNLFDKILLKIDDLADFQIFWKLNILQQSISHMFRFLIDEANLLLENFE